MSRPELIDEVDAMSPEDQLEFVQAIWDRIAAHPEAVPVPLSHLAELRRRFEDHEATPGDVVDWEVVKAGLRSAR